MEKEFQNRMTLPKIKLAAEEILKNMSWEEKATLVNGYCFSESASFPEYGLEKIMHLDGGTGLNFEQLFGTFCARDPEYKKYMATKVFKKVRVNFYHPENLETEEEKNLHAWFTKKLSEQCLIEAFAPTCFPDGNLMGATWNPEVVHAVGAALGKEAAAYQINCLLGTPFVNICRDPRAGRYFEGWSEDPRLMAELSPEIVKGVQEAGVGANVKHFAANNQETYRVGINETISERALEEIYLPAFQANVAAGVATVMSAYNSINGVRCTENSQLLVETLRKKWGFNGLVSSDWGAVQDDAAALLGGNDLAMPGYRSPKALLAALAKEEEAAGEKILAGHKVEELPLHNSLNYAADNMIRFMLAYAVKDNVVAKYLARTEKRANIESSLMGVEFEEERQPQLDMDEVKRRIALKQNFTKQLLQESDEAAYLAALDGIVLVKNAEAEDRKKLFPLSGKTALFGKGARELFTCGTGSAGITTNRNTNLYEELRLKMGDLLLDEIDQDTKNVIVVLRVNGMEGNDRENLQIPEEELAVLYEAMRKVQRMNGSMRGGNYANYTAVKMGVILNVAGPVDCREFIKDIDGMFVCFLPGGQGAKALAELMTGGANPSGRLPMTFPEKLEDTPTYLSFPGDRNNAFYGEDIFVGYRYYNSKGVHPLFPFGWGLSYTDFDYSPMTLTRVQQDETSELAIQRVLRATRATDPAYKEDGNQAIREAELEQPVVTVDFDLANIGRYAGAEVIQLYVQDPKSTLRKPERELRAFQKIYLAPGQMTHVTFTLKKRDFASYDQSLHEWTCEEGAYNLILARSASPEDTIQSEEFLADWESPYSYSLDTPLIELHKSEQAFQEIYLLFEANGIDTGKIEDAWEYTSFETVRCLVENATEDRSPEEREDILKQAENRIRRANRFHQ